MTELRKIAVVTGGTRGIGLEVVRGLVGSGYRVLAIGRDPATTAAACQSLGPAADNVTMLQADLASMTEVRRIAASIAEQAPIVDVLIHNAAVVRRTRELTPDGFEWQLAVNHLAPFLLTALLFPTLATGSARIVVTASQVERHGTLDFGDLTLARGYDASGAYSRTKLANVLFTYELARRIAGSGVTANCLHPGVVRTGLLNTLHAAARAKHRSTAGAIVSRIRSAIGGALRAAGLRAQPIEWALSPAEGARTTLFVATAPELAGVSGQYFREGHAAETSVASRDVETAGRLWDVSASLVGIAPDWTARQ